MPRTRIKICGITRPEDALLAAKLGADAIGLVFYKKSPRYIAPQQTQQVLAKLPPFVSRVALFVDAPTGEIQDILTIVRPDILQFHGTESAESCLQYKLPYIKAVRMQPGVNLHEIASEYESASALLLDTYQAGVPGGTGQAFDWTLVPADLPVPIILAGGLTPENVAQAIKETHPYAVDVSGGVEQAKGIKDQVKMRQFIQEVQRIG